MAYVSCHAERPAGALRNRTSGVGTPDDQSPANRFSVNIPTRACS